MYLRAIKQFMCVCVCVCAYIDTYMHISMYTYIILCVIMQCFKSVNMYMYVHVHVCVLHRSGHEDGRGEAHGTDTSKWQREKPPASDLVPSLALEARKSCSSRHWLRRLGVAAVGTACVIEMEIVIRLCVL